MGASVDTAEFSVKAIRNWWKRLGKKCYRPSGQLIIKADSGGSNNNRNRLWKCELQKTADETGLIIEVNHYPTGTRKWNKIEHRLLCHITRKWRDVPLESHQVFENIVNSTRTNNELEVHYRLDEATYEKGRKITDKEISEH